MIPLPTRRARAESCATASLVVLLLAAGCGEDTEDHGGRDGPVVFGKVVDAGEDALLEGEVQLIDGCLVVSLGERWVPVVWMHGTSWDEIDTAIRLPNGDEVRPGDRIAAGGGFHDATGLGWYVSDSDAIEHIERCVAASPSDGVYAIQHPVELLD